MPRDQETTSEPVPVGTRTGTWPADTTVTGPDDTTSSATATSVDDPATDVGADDVTARDASAGSGAFAGTEPSTPAPEGEWVAGTKNVSPTADASSSTGASPDLDAGSATGADSAMGAGPALDTDSAVDTDPAAGTVPAADTDPAAGPVPAADTDPAAGTVPAADTDPTRATVPDLGDPDLDAVPDPAASQSTGAAVTGADTTRLDQPATGAHAAPPAGTPGSAAGADAAFAAAGAALVTDADGFRASWVRIQSGFVDDPRGSVTEAAELVTQITSTLVSAVQERERTLRGTWDGSGDADTENLRNALRDYRSFFERLIGV